jgi:hypothetical protein
VFLSWVVAGALVAMGFALAVGPKVVEGETFGATFQDGFVVPAFDLDQRAEHEGLFMHKLVEGLGAVAEGG